MGIRDGVVSGGGGGGGLGSPREDRERGVLAINGGGGK